MAHRHTIQKRARGGGVRGGSKIDHNFSSPGANRIEDEAKSQKEEFHKGGKTVAKAGGGKVKARGDRFKRGGSVWSHAAEGLRGKKGFAGTEVPWQKGEHGELKKAKAGDTEKKHDAAGRRGHPGKAAHQYAKGGKVKAFAKGGAADPVDGNPEGEPSGDWEKKHAKGGRTAKARGGECDEDGDRD
jgi:hypothetical protein